MLKLAHLINPVLGKPSSDLFIAQPITFESMRIAQQQAKGQVTVDLLAVGYAEEKPVMPDGFQALPLLTRSVTDVATFQKQRKLPLLRDILDRLYGGSEADYLIYTNVDISLQPYFYLAVQKFIQQGHDAFIINRRTIPKKHTTIEELPQMWAEDGKLHRGWDCFIFQRRLYNSFDLGNVCIGAPLVGLVLLANLLAAANNFKEFKHEHLTFHLGDDRTWRNNRNMEYKDHNMLESEALLARLEARYGRFPRNTIPGSYLRKKQLAGPFYDWWARQSILPTSWSHHINQLFKKTSQW